MRHRIVTVAALLLVGLVAADIALGASCESLESGSAPAFSSHAPSSDEGCGPSRCVSDCFCCSVVASGSSGPEVLAPGPLSRSVEPYWMAALEGALSLPYHPPLS